MILSEMPTTRADHQGGKPIIEFILASVSRGERQRAAYSLDNKPGLDDIWSEKGSLQSPMKTWPWS